LARVMIMLVSTFVLYRIVLSRFVLDKSDSNIFKIYLTYLAFISFSIFGAINMVAYFGRYKDIIFPGLFLLSTLYYKSNVKPIIAAFLASSVLNFFYQIFMFALPGAFQSIGKYIVYSGHFELVLINLKRSRLFIETYDEILVPFVMLLILGSNKTWRKWGIILLLLIAVPSLLSNFRSRILMFAVALAGSLLFLSGKNLVKKLWVGIGVLVVGAVSVLVLNAYLGFSFVDRFTLQDTKEDVQTLDSRWVNITRSFDVGTQLVFTGVGLGNYYDTLPNSKSSIFTLINWVNRESQIAASNPHNIFAQIVSETGLFSLIFYTVMILYFLVLDMKAMRKKGNGINLALRISFWTLFSYSLFNPTTTVVYNSTFWILRGLIK
jgi:hypothetical protein